MKKLFSGRTVPQCVSFYVPLLEAVREEAKREGLNLSCYVRRVLAKEILEVQNDDKNDG